MAILLDPPSLTRRARPSSAAFWFVVYIGLVIIGGALLGGWLLHEPMISEEGVLYRFASEHGPDRIVRRLQTLLAILLAPLLLKKIGWRGTRDLGWNSDQTRRERKADFIRWFVIGLVLMAVLFILSLASGIREWLPFSFGRWAGRLFTAFLITGIGVGFIEETLTRGVLYRSMARVWTPWAGALVSSGIFAWAHFMKATDASFLEGPFAVLRSSLFDEFATDVTRLKFLNMFLFGRVLCRLVRHRGDIWAAVGLHAAAVGAFKWFSRQTRFVPEVGYQSWLGGHSSKFDDGWAMALMLFLVLLVNEAYHASRPSKLRVDL
jgi:membrane protease YdiL (CAAX protease family)